MYINGKAINQGFFSYSEGPDFRKTYNNYKWCFREIVLKLQCKCIISTALYYNITKFYTFIQGYMNTKQKLYKT